MLMGFIVASRNGWSSAMIGHLRQQWWTVDLSDLLRESIVMRRRSSMVEAKEDDKTPRLIRHQMLLSWGNRDSIDDWALLAQASELVALA
ncbi:hypothetical protein ACLOJK_009762 [Asimina triloba]